MEAPFISVENRSSKAKTIAIVTLAVVGTFAACFLLFNQSASSTMLDDRTAAYDSYVHWKNRNNFTFGGAMDSLRFEIFFNNTQYIKAHNQKESTYTLGLTPFAALTREEFAATRLGYKPRNKALYTSRIVELSTEGLADSVDWREKGAVTAVKNQGQCGSCWAFSTTGALEGYLGTTGQKLVSLSEQELVDCSTSYGNNGCNGGLMDNGFKYVEEHGIGSEKNYPYTAVDGKCNKKDTVLKIGSFVDVKPQDAAQLRAALNAGPVSVAIEADTSAFQLYTSGVITGTACGTQLDHGVLAVGYAHDETDKDNASKNYYIVKNSWGNSWGDQGYVKIAAVSGDAETDGVCGIQEAASYPTK